MAVRRHGRGAGSGPGDADGPRGGGMMGRGRKGGQGKGPDGNCICPDCGEKIPHKRGLPCVEMVCPRCGSAMTRE